MRQTRSSAGARGGIEGLTAGYLQAAWAKPLAVNRASGERGEPLGRCAGDQREGGWRRANREERSCLRTGSILAVMGENALIQGKNSTTPIC